MESLPPAQLQKRFILKDASFSHHLLFETYYFNENNQLEYMGFLSFLYHPFSNTLVWQDVYPLFMASFLTYAQSSFFTKDNKKRSFGLGSLAHTQALLLAYQQKKELLTGIVKSSTAVKSSRRAQLKHMGLLSKPTPFHEYVQKSIEYVSSKGFVFPEKVF